MRYTFLGDIQLIQDRQVILIKANVKNIHTKSAKVDGNFIKEYSAIVELQDASGSTELFLDSIKLKELKAMDLEKEIVFKVKIMPKDNYTSLYIDSIYRIHLT
jgi:hypothetical protein